MQKRQTTIVVGAGSAGGIVAARLSEDPEQRVILIEAGPDYATIEELPESLRDAFNPQLTGHDWGMDAYFIEPSEARPRTPYPRGRVVGGSSAVNGTVGVRGKPEDFDRWASMGNPSWAWDKVLPSFLELENDFDYGEGDYHAIGGPITIFRFPESEWPLTLRYLKQDLIERGIPDCPDVNKPDATGVGAVPRNQTGDLRGSTWLTHLLEARKRSNLEIRADTNVLRVVIENGRAVGVEVESARDGARELIHADRVVLSAGAIKSPQILQLSGIGPAQALERIGIPVVHELIGVGQNLQDHPGIALIATAKQAEPERHGFRLYVRTSSSAGGENDLLFCPGQMAIKALNFQVDTDAEDIVNLNVLLAKPESKGWLSLRSASVNDQPEIHINFLSADTDLERLKEGYRTLVELVTNGTVATALASIVYPGPEHYGDDLLSWLDTPGADAWIRQTLLTAYHAAGTCKMGPSIDPMSVVGDHLQVHGIQDLYVVDASIMPEITNAMTALTTCMIGHHFVSLLTGRI
jgi:choline dehydrogenase